jgi:hypothetical protein
VLRQAQHEQAADAEQRAVHHPDLIADHEAVGGPGNDPQPLEHEEAADREQRDADPDQNWPERAHQRWLTGT